MPRHRCSTTFRSTISARESQPRGTAPITCEHLQSTHVESGRAGDRGDRGLHGLGSHTREGTVETAIRHPRRTAGADPNSGEGPAKVPGPAVKFHDDATLVSERIG